ncbi:MAG TPA: response regulator [Thermoanaerobaculia bacterium]|nr:response regulator [Thermoanaerobaculia bacterium]
MRLLLIDDSPDDRLLARRALLKDFADLPLEVEEIGDPESLRRFLEAGGFDAVVTDYQLQWGDGLEVLRDVKALFPGCPVVMFTSSGDEEVAVEAMKSGLDDYILKTPRHYSRLPVALRTALDRAAMRRELEEERARRLEREREARLAAESASQMKDEFLATLSHELRTPLNAIVGWAALLRTGDLQGEKFLRAVESIERNARAQARLIEDLLDVSAIIFGKLSLEARPIDLLPVVEGAVDVVRATAEAKGVRLESRLKPGAGPLLGDPDRLQQVAWNLLSNAIKFTPRGGTVEVVLETFGEYVRLTVCDDGPGIDPTFHPFLFEPFRQANRTLTRRHGGLGLGLAIVKRLVDLHGGEVRAENRGPGQGARFVVDLPLNAEPPERRAQPADGLRASGIECPPQLDGLRILVVDDEPDSRELVSTILTECGAEVATAASVEEALGVLEPFQPDVLISDIAMPERDGYELIRAIRERASREGSARLPAVALTAHARAEDRLRSFQSGFDLHVVKPVDPAELLGVVATLSGRPWKE